MRRHAFGLLGYASSALVSFALVFLFGPSSPGRDVAARSYGGSVTGWEACGPGSGEAGLVYAASDGARLFFVSRDFESAERARTALDALVGYEATPVQARSRRGARACGGRTYLIFARNQISDPADPARLASSDYAVVWLRGNRLVGIYGPTIAHVMELEAANPESLW